MILLVSILFQKFALSSTGTAYEITCPISGPVTMCAKIVRREKTAGVKKVLILVTQIILKLVENVNDGISTFLIRYGILGQKFDVALSPLFNLRLSLDPLCRSKFDQHLRVIRIVLIRIMTNLEFGAIQKIQKYDGNTAMFQNAISRILIIQVWFLMSQSLLRLQAMH